MEITIRRAVAADCKRILELVRELAVYEKAPQEVTVSLAHFTESGFGPNPVWWAFVATSFSLSAGGEPKETIHGFALYYIRFSTWKGKAMYLEDILVTEKMRGHKIGTLLFDRLFEEAREKGFRRICWQVLEWNEPAINFYKKYNASFDGEWINCAVDVH
ncbi:GNAT family acetyltransferase [Niabella ginsenosidivorans]|uniref:GNAT family acetyltransferase n=1 Tax=Niabella ginsenosidivorans TaxID=1176587 RepID=A0A1A9I3Q0_9BACT|nr:GNAT family N-acetyltransferase [Niabella ginsenosidivorans]ANH82297.1 GNAT family acetyltransferase [Niabella ginsenosidivorans]